MIDIYRLCKKYFLSFKSLVYIYVIVCIISGVLSLSIPYLSGKFVDFLVTGTDVSFLYKYSILFAILSLTTLIIGYFSSLLETKLQTQISFDIKNDIVKHIQKLSISFISNINISYLNQRIISDANTLTSFCLQTIQSFLINTVMITLSLFMLFTFNIQLAKIIIILIIIFGIVFNIYRNTLYIHGYDLKEKQSSFFSKIQEQLTLTHFIKNNGIHSTFIQRLTNSFQNLLNSSVKYQKVSYLFSSLENIITTIAQIFLYILGGLDVLQGNITIGEFSIISAYFTILMNSVRYFFNFGKMIQDNKVSYDRINELFNYSPESEGKIKIDDINSIHLNKVNFLFGDKDIIRNFTYTFKKGKIYSLSGVNGSGKSTIMNLLTGHYIDEYKGEILYNNVNIKKINLSFSHKHLIGIAEQKPILLKDTLKYNLLLDNEKEINDQNFTFLINALGMKSFIDSLPNGIDTIVNEEGLNLSGGEKSKIALLRVLLKKPKVILLDEPTAALDTYSREKLLSYLRAIKENSIIIIITHDINVLNISDEIINLNKIFG